MASVVGLILRRILWAVIVLFAVISFMFFFMRLLGDPISAIVGENADSEAFEAARARYGFDQPLTAQYFDYLGGLTRGDFGISFRYLGQPALPLILERLPATAALAGIALVGGLLVAIPVGIVAALRPGSFVDSLSRVTAVAGLAVPSFWLGILLIIVFSVHLQLLPAGGSGSIQHLILPSLALTVFSIPLTMRLVRSSMLEVLSQEFLKTARAKGISERAVILRHALRNALITIITAIAVRAGQLISGAVVIEEVFAYPGLGRLALESIRQRDFFVIQAFVVVVATILIVINLIADILYGVVDPRVRVQ